MSSLNMKIQYSLEKSLVFYRYLYNEQHIFIERWIKMFHYWIRYLVFFNKIIPLNLSISKAFMSLFFLCNLGNIQFLFMKVLWQGHVSTHLIFHSFHLSLLAKVELKINECHHLSEPVVLLVSVQRNRTLTSDLTNVGVMS